MNTNAFTPVDSQLHYFNVKVPPVSAMWRNLLFHFDMQNFKIKNTIRKNLVSFSSQHCLPSLLPLSSHRQGFYLPFLCGGVCRPTAEAEWPAGCEFKRGWELGRPGPHSAIWLCLWERDEEGKRETVERSKDEGVGQNVWENEKSLLGRIKKKSERELYNWEQRCLNS